MSAWPRLGRFSRSHWRRARSWGWFGALLLAAIISGLAYAFAFSFYGLIALVGLDPLRAHHLFGEPLYVIVTNSLAGLTMFAQLLYALCGPGESLGAPVAPVSANDATLH